MSAHSLYKWVKAAKPDGSEQRASELLQAKSEVLKLRAQLRRTEEERHSEKGRKVLCSAARVKYRFINEHMGTYRVATMCRVAEVGSGSFSPPTESYLYDPLYRLGSVTDAGKALASYTYNPSGDRLSKTASGLATGAYGYTSGTHRLVSTGTATRANDANGNTTGSVIGGSTYGFGYNGRNRLTITQLGGATVGTYIYNAMGERINKVATSPQAVTERYSYDEAGQLIGEYGTANRDYIWAGDLLVAVIDNTLNGSVTTSTVNYVTTDHLGTPRAVTNSAGTVIWQWAYQGNPFGEAQPTSSTGYVLNLRYPGQHYDAESASNYNVFRNYEPIIGRYQQSDPIGLDGGISAYAYVGNNPINYVDPLGLKDYRDECVGRYSMCTASQDPNGSTIKNYLMFKGCKATVDAGTEKAPSKPAGVAIACQADFHDCVGGRNFDDPDLDRKDPKVLQCSATYLKCVSGGGE